MKQFSFILSDMSVLVKKKKYVGYFYHWIFFKINTLYCVALDTVFPAGRGGELEASAVDEAFRTRSLPAWVRNKSRPLATLDDLNTIYEKVRWPKISLGGCSTISKKLKRTLVDHRVILRGIHFFFQIVIIFVHNM